MKKAIMYIHGKGGNADEAKRFEDVCKGYDVYGLDYKGNTPWDTKGEIIAEYDLLATKYDSVTIIANSIGAYFAMHALHEKNIEKALFISPIVDMKRLIEDMMMHEGVSEKELFEKQEIETEFGETLSWSYLQYVKDNPVKWSIPTAVLYAGGDKLTSRKTVDEFVACNNASLTVMEDGEHWFHTQEQLAFLDSWVRSFCSSVRS